MEFSALLCARAFEMLCSGETFLEQADKELPDEILRALSEQRLIVRRDDDYHFRHDFYEHILRPITFVPSWQRTLTDQTINIDMNWRAMLEFAVLEICEPVEVGKLFGLTPKRNTRLAGELFKWLEQAQPPMMSPWSDDFKRVW